jgi:hypothetical protein
VASNLTIAMNLMLIKLMKVRRDCSVKALTQEINMDDMSAMLSLAS